MQFRCVNIDQENGDHGKIEYIEGSGYSIAHDLDRRIHEKDLEGITFVIHASDGELTEDDIEAETDRAERYLEKFPYVYEEIAKLLNRRGWLGEDYWCPHCGKNEREPFVMTESNFQSEN